MRPSRLAAVAALTAGLLAGAVGFVPTAAADEQPSILKAYGLDWIERVRDDAWPQPKDQRPVICLLDTGVAVTPDTPADDPNGPIVARLAIDGGSGLPQGDTFEHLHGTTMASVIAAPRNGWGTVGVFPQARIVSIRVTIDDATYITPAAVRAGARACRVWALNQEPVASIGSVVMAESNYDQRPSDSDAWEASAKAIDDVNGVFVAAVGNSEEATVLPPVSAQGVLSIAAGDDQGSLCSFAKYPPETGLIGPGCSTVTSWPAGSSAATAAVGAVVDALAARAPEQPAQARVAAIMDSARLQSGSSAKAFDGTQLSAEFFSGLVAASATSTLPGPVAAPTVAAPTSPQMVVSPVRPLPSATPTVTKLWRPTVTATRRGKSIVIRRTDHRGKGVLTWSYETRQGAVSASAISPSNAARFRPVSRVRSLAVWVQEKSTGGWRSMARHVRVSMA
ncbi:MAG: S8/S53 family peptidase [Patulibacter sp.]|nr:S8/S53 family peptidase [Patulibacter sp.]